MKTGRTTSSLRLQRRGHLGSLQSQRRSQHAHCALHQHSNSMRPVTVYGTYIYTLPVSSRGRQSTLVQAWLTSHGNINWPDISDTVSSNEPKRTPTGGITMCPMYAFDAGGGMSADQLQPQSLVMAYIMPYVLQVLASHACAAPPGPAGQRARVSQQSLPGCRRTIPGGSAHACPAMLQWTLRPLWRRDRTWQRYAVTAHAGRARSCSGGCAHTY